MADNGGHNKQPPQEGPPDLVDLFKKMFSNKKSAGSSSQSEPGDGSKNKHYIVYGIAAVVVIWALFGFFLVAPAQQAVVLRFGKYVTTPGPGVHWIPLMIDSKHKINVQQVSNFSYEAEMLTQDENIVSVSLAVQYRIANPRNYLFNVVDPITTLQQATSSALRQVVGQMTLNSILTTGRQQLRDMVAKQLNQTLEIYKAGLKVTDVTLQPAKPPEAVTAAFDDAIKAREDEQRYINQANAYSRKVLSQVKGQVARLLTAANAYKREVVLHAKGATARYLALLKPYQQAPTVTRERLYLDTVASVLSKTSNVIVDSRVNNLLYLPIDQIMKRQMHKAQKSEASAPTDNSTMVPEPSNAKATQASSANASNSNRPSYPIGGGDY